MQFNEELRGPFSYHLGNPLLEVDLGEFGSGPSRKEWDQGLQEGSRRRECKEQRSKDVWNSQES